MSETKAEAWSQTFKAPGVSKFAKFALVAITALAAAQAQANATGKNQKFTNLLPMLGMRYTAAQAAGLYNYVLANLDKKPTIVGVSFKTGEADRKAVMDKKNPDYIVDELGGALINVKGKKTIQYFDLK